MKMLKIRTIWFLLFVVRIDQFARSEARSILSAENEVDPEEIIKRTPTVNLGNNKVIKIEDEDETDSVVTGDGLKELEDLKIRAIESSRPFVRPLPNFLRWSGTGYQVPRKRVSRRKRSNTSKHKDDGSEECDQFNHNKCCIVHINTMRIPPDPEHVVQIWKYNGVDRERESAWKASDGMPPNYNEGWRCKRNPENSNARNIGDCNNGVFYLWNVTGYKIVYDSGTSWHYSRFEPTKCIAKSPSDNTNPE